MAIAISERRVRNPRVGTSGRTKAAPAVGRFVLSAADGKRLLDSLNSEPEPMSEKALSAIADYKQVRVIR